MKLYRLKNKQTGKFLAACSLFRRPQWTATGVFFRKIDTIRKHAEAICRDWEIHHYTEIIQDGRYRRQRWTVKEKAHHPNRMKDLIVVVNDVTFNGEEEIEATKIFKKERKK